jgi:glycosyltransferase involved in cell wall biosynthesis
VKISVIIAVYNQREEYLRECFHSLIAQTCKNTEYIVIDDGSFPKTVALIDELARSDDRFRVYHECNRGAGAARNQGLDRASGDYIAFLDHDDYWLSPDFLSDAAKLLDESRADVLSLEYTELYDDKDSPKFERGHLPREKIFRQSRENALNTLLKSKRNIFSSHPANKIVSRRFLSENNIRFQENVYCEDIYYTAQIVAFAQSFDRYDFAVYAMRRVNSITTSREKRDAIIDSFPIIFEKILSDTNLSSDRYVLNFLASPYAYWLGRLATRQDKTRQDKTRHDKTRQDKTRQDKTRQDKARHDKTRQGKTRQEKTRPGKTKQDKTRKEKTGDDGKRQWMGGWAAAIL